MAHRADRDRPRRDDRTRTWLLTAALLALAVLAAVAVGLGSLHGAARGRLDEAFGERLVGVAATTARLVDADSVAALIYDPLAIQSKTEGLEQIRRDAALADLTICDPDGEVLFSSAGRYQRNDYNTLWDLESGALAAACAGVPTASNLYDANGIMQKSAHAPVLNINGEVIAIVSVEAEAEFFGSLGALRGGAWATGAVVLLVLVVLLTGLARLLRDIVRYRASLAEQEKLAAMGRMTAGIAHEIRNPLGIMRGAGEALQLRLEGLGQDATLAGFVVEEVDRLDGILTRYLTFGSGGGLECEPHDLEKIARATLRNLADEMAAAGVTTACSARGESRAATVDPAAIQQLLINLLLNARDAAAGSPDARVEIVLDHGPDHVIMTVTDTGPGLGGADPEAFFVPFRTTKEKGSGLGLPIVRQVAEDHGGSVRLGDRADARGAAAIIELPYAGPAAEGS